MSTPNHISIISLPPVGQPFTSDDVEAMWHVGNVPNQAVLAEHISEMIDNFVDDVYYDAEGNEIIPSPADAKAQNSCIIQEITERCEAQYTRCQEIKAQGVRLAFSEEYPYGCFESRGEGPLKAKYFNRVVSPIHEHSCGYVGTAQMAYAYCLVVE